MKKLIFTLALSGAFVLTATTASARGVIVYSNGEKIEVVRELPADVELIEQEHVNIGVMYKQFSIFWIPMWNYGETSYVLVNDAKDTYYDLTAEEIDMLNDEWEMDLPAKPRIGFWNSIGGKLIWGAVILFALWGWWSTRKDDEEAEIPASPEVPATDTEAGAEE